MIGVAQQQGTAGNNVAKIPPGNPTGGTAFGGLGLLDARGIAPGFDHNMWIVDAGANDIKRITTAGLPGTISTAHGLPRPQVMAPISG